MGVTLKDIPKLLETTGLPVVYHSFTENEAPQLPFICYLFTGTNNFAADGQVYANINRIQIELYTQHKDIEVEKKLENALVSLFWEKSEEYIDSERCFQIVYELEV